MISFLQKYFSPLILTVILMLYGLFGFQHLGQFITADEHYWVYERIPQYWDAVTEGKWKKTLINDKPGISLALVSGMALTTFPDPNSLCSRTEERIITCDTTEAESMLFTFRLFILGMNALLLLYLFWIVRRLANPTIALWSTAFMALSPILLGISQIVNPDALLWSFGSAALFSYLAALRFYGQEKKAEKKYVLLSGLFLGMAILSKYTGSILIPFFLLSAVASALALYPTTDQARALKHLRTNLFLFLSSLLIAIATIVLLLPATWQKPALLLNLLSGGTETPFIFISLFFFAFFLIDAIVFRGRSFFLLQSALKKITAVRFTIALLPWGILFLSLFLILGRILFPDWSLFATTPFDAKDLTSTYLGVDINPHVFESILLEMNPLIFSLTPIVLFFFLITLLRLPTDTPSDTPWHLEKWLLILFLPLFIGLLILLDVLATPRYLIILYPVVAFLAACGLWESRLFVEKRWPRLVTLPLLQTTAVTFLVIIISGSSLVASKPFLLNYTNPLLPKAFLISDAWGSGGYEAAQYLNSLPDAANLLVWTDYEGVCEFFVGQCMLKQYKYSNQQKIDYAVLTRRGKILYDPNHSRWAKEGNFSMKQAYDDPTPDWQLAINDRPENFVKVVKVDNRLDVAIVTDIDHCPSRAAVSEEQLQSFLSYSREQEVDFIASLGDNASHRLRDCSKTGDEDARSIAETLRGAGLPVHLILGDHDISSSVSSYRAWLETIERDQTYYSFYANSVHVIVLDTVLGGEPLRTACEDDPHCSVLTARLADLEALSFPAYRGKYQDALTPRSRELRFITDAQEEARRAIALTRSFGNRDRGRLGEEELAWLKEDIGKTPLEKILILSDHPLFPFTSEKKRYDIVNGETARAILEESGKEIVAISGEAHLWHEETLNGIRYFIVDEFRKQNGSWAHASWDEDGFRLERITH